jgi:hypothetical protein
MREKVKFSEGKPVMVKLDFNDGTACASRDGGQQYQYTLDDDIRIMYVDPAIRNYILSEGCMAGDVVEITKHGADARAWEVRKALRSVQGAAAFPPAAAAQQPRTQQAQPAAQQQAAAQPAAPISSRTLEMVAALIGAIDAAAEAERYAARQGMPLKFDRGDIRAIAATLYIGKDGR